MFWKKKIQVKHTDFGDIIASRVSAGSVFEFRFSNGTVSRFKVKSATPDSVEGYFEVTKGFFEPTVSVLNPDQIVSFKLL